MLLKLLPNSLPNRDRRYAYRTDASFETLSESKNRASMPVFVNLGKTDLGSSCTNGLIAFSDKNRGI